MAFSGDCFYDIEEWIRKLSDQLNPVNVARKNEKTNASAHLIRYRFKIREGSPEGIRKTRFVKDGESEGGDW